MLSVSLAFLVVAMATSAHIGVPIRDPEGTLLGKRIVAPFIFMFAFFSIDVLLRARRRWCSEPVPAMLAVRDTFLQRWWWKRIVIALLGFFSFHLTYLSYRNLKSFVPLINYDSYDRILVQTDRWLMLGNDPAQLLHALLGTQLSAHVLSSIYLAYIPFVPISIAAALTFTRRMRDGYVYVCAANYCWILGTVSYYLIPSLGPFGGPTRWQFEDLATTGVTTVQDSLVWHKLLLYSDPAYGGGIQSIGGFASLHVAMVFMAYLFVRHHGHRLLACALIAALVPTVVATVYFGWHYIVDDAAGLLIGWLAFVAARWTVDLRASWLALRRRAIGRSSRTAPLEA